MINYDREIKRTINRLNNEIKQQLIEHSSEPWKNYLQKLDIDKDTHWQMLRTMKKRTKTHNQGNGRNILEYYEEKNPTPMKQKANQGNNFRRN